MKFPTWGELDFNDVSTWPFAVKVLAIASLCAIILAGGAWFEYKKQWPQLELARAEERELRSQIQVKAAKAANLEAYSEQLAEMQKTFGTMLRQLPNKAEVADLLIDISQTGLASGLEFELFKPQNEIPKDFYAELPINIRVTGSYHEFGEFVSGLAALPRIVTLHDIDIKPIEEKARTNDPAPESDEVDRLIMQVTANTYRYLEEGKSQ